MWNRWSTVYFHTRGYSLSRQNPTSRVYPFDSLIRDMIFQTSVDPLGFALTASLLGLILYSHWQLTVGVARRRIIAKHGCEPIKPIVNLLPLTLA